MVKVFCLLCNKRCRGNVLKVDEAFIHKSCFKCSVCSTTLERGGFYRREAKFYCRQDYLNAFGSRCGKCGEFVEGEVVTTLGKTFHPHCFACATCKKQFQAGDKATLFGGMYLCTLCMYSHRHPVPGDSSQPGRAAMKNRNGENARNGSGGDSDTSCFPDSSLQVTSDSEGFSGGESLQVTPQHRQAHSAQTLGSPPTSKLASAVSDGQHFPVVTHAARLKTRNQTQQMSQQTNQVNGPAAQNGTSRSATMESSSSSSSVSMHPLYQHSYLYREMEVDASLGLVSKDRYLRSRSGYGTPSGHTPGGRSRSPSPIHFHRPPGETFSYRRQPNYVSEMRRVPGLTAACRSHSAQPSSRVHFSPSTVQQQVEQHHQHPPRPEFSGAHLTPHPTPPTVMLLHSRPPSAPPLGEGVNANVEIRRLACYPAGQEPGSSSDAGAMERPDWPGPPLTAVILMEKRGAEHPTEVSVVSNGGRSMSYQTILLSPSCPLMSGREPQVVNRIPHEMIQSLSTSSTGLSPMSPRGTSDEDNISAYSSSHVSSVSGAPIKSILVRHHRRGSDTPTNDSAATGEKTPEGHVVRPGGGLESDGDNVTLTGYMGDDRVSMGQDNTSRVTGLTTRTLYCPPSVQDWLRTTKTASSMFLNYPHCKPPPTPHRTLSYEVLSSASARPKGLDYNNLEAHLSDEEFLGKFRMTRQDFNQLPEWKRNDLKFRIGLL